MRVSLMLGQTLQSAERVWDILLYEAGLLVET